MFYNQFIIKNSIKVAFFAMFLCCSSLVYGFLQIENAEDFSIVKNKQIFKTFYGYDTGLEPVIMQMTNLPEDAEWYVGPKHGETSSVFFVWRPLEKDLGVHSGIKVLAQTTNMVDWYELDFSITVLDTNLPPYAKTIPSVITNFVTDKLEISFEVIDSDGDGGKARQLQEWDGMRLVYRGGSHYRAEFTSDKEQEGQILTGKFALIDYGTPTATTIVEFIIYIVDKPLIAEFSKELLVYENQTRTFSIDYFDDEITVQSTNYVEAALSNCIFLTESNSRVREGKLTWDFTLEIEDLDKGVYSDIWLYSSCDTLGTSWVDRITLTVEETDTPPVFITSDLVFEVLVNEPFRFQVEVYDPDTEEIEFNTNFYNYYPFTLISVTNQTATFECNVNEVKYYDEVIQVKYDRYRLVGLSVDIIAKSNLLENVTEDVYKIKMNSRNQYKIKYVGEGAVSATYAPKNKSQSATLINLKINGEGTNQILKITPLPGRDLEFGEITITGGHFKSVVIKGSTKKYDYLFDRENVSWDLKIFSHVDKLIVNNQNIELLEYTSPNLPRAKFKALILEFRATNTFLEKVSAPMSAFGLVQCKKAGKFVVPGRAGGLFNFGADSVNVLSVPVFMNGAIIVKDRIGLCAVRDRCVNQSIVVGYDISTTSFVSGVAEEIRINRIKDGDTYILGGDLFTNEFGYYTEDVLSEIKVVKGKYLQSERRLVVVSKTEPNIKIPYRQKDGEIIVLTSDSNVSTNTFSKKTIFKKQMQKFNIKKTNKWNFDGFFD